MLKWIIAALFRAIRVREMKGYEISQSIKELAADQ